MSTVALIRSVPASLADCELTHLERTAIDVPTAAAQHEEYERALRSLGCRIVRLHDAPDLPDSVFVEDMAIVLDEIAVLTRPGAASRRAETASVEDVLSQFRPLLRLTAPATLDGGDVLRLGRRLFVGASGRTNDAGIAQLRDLLAPCGYTVTPVPVEGCLHLKSAVTAADEDLLVCNPEWVDAEAFDGCSFLEVDPDEPFAANVLRVGGAVLCAAAHPRTNAALAERGFEVCEVDLAELAKAEGAITCCSIVLES